MKSFEEVKSVVDKFPQASGAGYVVGPALLKIASQKLDNPLYQEAFDRWSKSPVGGEEVGDSEELKSRHNLFFVYDGPAIREEDGVIYVGIKETIEDVSNL